MMRISNIILRSANNQNLNNSKLKSNKTFNLNNVGKNENIGVSNYIPNYDISFCNKPIYVIDYDGSYEKYPLAKAVIKDMPGVYLVLRGRTFASKGKVAVYANKVENNGEVDINAIKKAISTFKDADSQPIYSIDLDGNVRRFDSGKVAAKDLKCSVSGISMVLNEHKDVCSGYAFVKAYDIEVRDENGRLLKDKHGKHVLDQKIINRIRERMLYSIGKFPIVSIDKDGDVKKYRDASEAILDTGFDEAAVYNSIERSCVVKNKYVFARLLDVVKMDEHGNVVFDENNEFILDLDVIERHKNNLLKQKKD